jgi:hypothetical protein
MKSPMKTLNRVLVVFALILCTCSAQESSIPVSETGFISPGKYTNAFFGFSLPLPQDSVFTGFQLPSTGGTHSLYGTQAHTKNGLGLTAFIIVANQLTGASSDQAGDAAASFKAKNVKKIQLSGKEFWKGESEQNGTGGKMRTVMYATAIDDYVLKFQITSFNGKLAKELEQCVEAVQFFEPAKAQEIAGANSRPYNSAIPQNLIRADLPYSTRIGQLSMGVVAGNTYKNDALGISYVFPAGWVINDKATQDKVMRAGHEFAYGDNPDAAREHIAFQQCARVLLMATKYPEGTKSEEINPYILVMAGDSACSPNTHFPISIDDKESIKGAAKEILHAVAGTPFVSERNVSVNAFVVQNHLMLDISNSFQVDRGGGKTPLDIYSSIDVTQLDNYLVAWCFMSGSPRGLQELKTTQIAFAKSKQFILTKPIHLPFETAKSWLTR